LPTNKTQSVVVFKLQEWELNFANFIIGVNLYLSKRRIVSINRTHCWCYKLNVAEARRTVAFRSEIIDSVNMGTQKEDQIILIRGEYFIEKVSILLFPESF